MGEDRRPVAFDLLGQHYSRAGKVENRLQRIAALVELPWAQVVTIEKQEIERVEDRPIRRCSAPPLVAERGLQRSKVRAGLLWRFNAARSPPYGREAARILSARQATAGQDGSAATLRRINGREKSS